MNAVIAMVTTYPCESCDSNRMVYEVPPYGICTESPTHDHECAKMQAVARVAERAEQVAALIAREPDRRLRAEEARNASDAFANTLFEMDAELDDTAFLSACGVPRACIDCERRRPSDGWDRLCGSCDEAEVAA